MDRKEALEKLLIMQCKYRHIRKKDDEWEAIETAIQALQEPERKKGRWTTDLRCSACDYPVEYHGGRTDFCPNCGADMRGNKKLKQVLAKELGCDPDEIARIIT